MTLILASGHGLGSFSAWLSGSLSVPVLLQLDVQLVPNRPYGTGGRRSYEVSFRWPSSRSQLLLQVLHNMSSDSQLMSWSVLKAVSGSWATSGELGEGSGSQATKSTTERVPISS